jgi:hypothetical protein
MTENRREVDPPEIARIEEEIDDTRRSLERKIDEIERRLQPDEVRAELKAALRRRLDIEPWQGWIAASLVVTGGILAYRGWRKSRHPVEPERLLGCAPGVL